MATNVHVHIGHNSAASLVVDGKVIRAYEEERLSKIKSDSAFPKLAIQQLFAFGDYSRLNVDNVFYTTWFQQDDNEAFRRKYLQKNFFYKYFPGAGVYHQDHYIAHYESCKYFSDCDAYIILDGFGNEPNHFGEVLNHEGKVIRKSRFSFGLLYQYFTNELGLKVHQDEYKILGLESKITYKDYEKVYEIAKKQCRHFLELNKEDYIYLNPKIEHKDSSRIVKGWYEQFRNHFNKWLFYKACEKANVSISEDKNYGLYLYAAFAQACYDILILDFILEVVETQLYYESITKIGFGGGCFYNVKTNNLIRKQLFHEYSVECEFHPVCGDAGLVLQGQYDNLFLGTRPKDLFSGANYDIRRIDKDIFAKCVGRMEFGPRALGNTSIIATPSLEVCNRINDAFKRKDYMPMAPITTESALKHYNIDYEGLGRCKYFMTCAYDIKDNDSLEMAMDNINGVIHHDHAYKSATTRAQIVEESPHLEDDKSFIINTSLNAHGQPICFDNIDLVYALKHFGV